MTYSTDVSIKIDIEVISSNGFYMNLNSVDSNMRVYLTKDDMWYLVTKTLSAIENSSKITTSK